VTAPAVPEFGLPVPVTLKQIPSDRTDLWSEVEAGLRAAGPKTPRAKAYPKAFIIVHRA